MLVADKNPISVSVSPLTRAQEKLFPRVVEVMVGVAKYMEVSATTCRNALDTPLAAPPFEFEGIDFVDLNFQLSTRFQVPPLSNDRLAEVKEKYGPTITLRQVIEILEKHLAYIEDLKKSQSILHHQV